LQSLTLEGGIAASKVLSAEGEEGVESLPLALESPEEPQADSQAEPQEELQSEPLEPVAQGAEPQEGEPSADIDPMLDSDERAAAEPAVTEQESEISPSVPPSNLESK